MKDKNLIASQPYNYFLIIFFVLVSVSTVYWYFRPEASKEINRNPLDQQLQVVTQQNAFFYSEVFLNRDKTFISIPYQFQTSPHMVTLSLATQENSPEIKRIVDHPIFHSLDWQTIKDDFLTLYQRNPSYVDIPSFLASPPPGEEILIDEFLTSLKPYDQLGSKILVPESNVDGVNYVLTSYSIPRVESNVYYYETIIDAQTALPNEKNELVWLLEIPTATTMNAFYIGNIHVDYRQ